MSPGLNFGNAFYNHVRRNLNYTVEPERGGHKDQMIHFPQNKKNPARRISRGFRFSHPERVQTTRTVRSLYIY